MARNAAGGFWSHVRSRARIARCCLGGASSLVAGLVLISFALPAVGQTDPVKGEAAFAEANGYARLVLKLEVPPLEERTEDIPLLARHLLLKSACRQSLDLFLSSASVLGLF